VYKLTSETCTLRESVSEKLSTKRVIITAQKLSEKQTVNRHIITPGKS